MLMDAFLKEIVDSTNAILEKQRAFLTQQRHSGKGGQPRRRARAEIAELLSHLRDTTKAWVSLRFCAVQTSSKIVRDLAAEAYGVVHELEHAILEIAENHGQP